MRISNRVRTDAELCADITRSHARTFTAASQFLPAEKRRAAFAVYAFCRVADDIVDEAVHAPLEAEAQLERHRSAFVETVRGNAGTPLFRELGWAMHRYDIPPAPFHGLVDMLRVDLAPFEFVAWPDLERYCGGVASTVGEMCAHVFGLPAAPGARAEALRHAGTLGVALQLTNVLRDVGEDALRGRCYLPTEDLRRFDIARSEILERTIAPADARWQALMRFEIRRTRDLYASAAPGLAMLDRDAQCCASICSVGYAAILDAIEQRSLDTLSGRAHIHVARKVRIMFSAWRTTRRPVPPAASGVVADAGERQSCA